MDCNSCKREIISKFKTGDVVIHKASRTPMVIIKPLVPGKDYHGSYASYPAYDCRYLKGDGYFSVENFNEFELEISK